MGAVSYGMRCSQRPPLIVPPSCFDAKGGRNSPNDSRVWRGSEERRQRLKASELLAGEKAPAALDGLHLTSRVRLKACAGTRRYDPLLALGHISGRA